MNSVDRRKLKEELSLEDVQMFVDSFGGESHIVNENTLICKTICHGGSSHKLYYYNNTKLFCCYTDCGDTFDIFELTRRIKQKESWSIHRATTYVASFFGYNCLDFSFGEVEPLNDWQYFKRQQQINEITTNQKLELEHYDESVLDYFPQPHLLDWEKEGIKDSVSKAHHICYNPINHSIIIPHYDIDNNLVGIRERTLIKEQEQYGKYKPAIIGGKMYNHPLSFNLYNLNHSKKAIKLYRKAIIFESEKSCLKYASYFGEENDISVAVCGSSLLSYHIKLLLELGVEEIIIAFDRQYQTIGDAEFKRWTKKLNKISKKFRAYVNISYIFDTSGVLDYKDAPVDKDKDTFLFLFNNRLNTDGK